MYFFIYLCKKCTNIECFCHIDTKTLLYNNLLLTFFVDVASWTDRKSVV